MVKLIYEENNEGNKFIEVEKNLLMKCQPYVEWVEEEENDDNVLNVSNKYYKKDTVNNIIRYLEGHVNGEGVKLTDELIHCIPPPIIKGKTLEDKVPEFYSKYIYSLTRRELMDVFKAADWFNIPSLLTLCAAAIGLDQRGKSDEENKKNYEDGSECINILKLEDTVTTPYEPPQPKKQDIETETKQPIEFN